MIIAIDGPAGAGKSSVAKGIAKRLGLIYIDTGAMYRALTLKAVNCNLDINDENEMEKLLKDTNIDLHQSLEENNLKVLIDNFDATEEIRNPRISSAVSTVSKHKKVRDIMVFKQRKISESEQGIVMDGRDIGTIVFPDADIKIFLTASVEERAKRRFKEQIEKGINTDINDLITEIKQRDELDSNRRFSPLKPANDSLIVDTTNLSFENVINKLFEIVNNKKGKIE